MHRTKLHGGACLHQTGSSDVPPGSARMGPRTACPLEEHLRPVSAGRTADRPQMAAQGQPLHRLLQSNMCWEGGHVPRMRPALRHTRAAARGLSEAGGDEAGVHFRKVPPL